MKFLKSVSTLLTLFGSKLIDTGIDTGINFLKWRFTHWIIHFKIDRYLAQNDISKNPDLAEYIENFFLKRAPDKVFKIKSYKKRNWIYKNHIVEYFDDKIIRDISGMLKPIAYKKTAWINAMEEFKEYLDIEPHKKDWKKFIDTICLIVEESFFVSQNTNNQQILNFLQQKNILDHLNQIKTQNETLILSRKDSASLIEKLEKETKNKIENLIDKIEEINIVNPQDLQDLLEEVNKKLDEVINSNASQNQHYIILYNSIFGIKQFLMKISKDIQIIKSHIEKDPKCKINELYKFQTLYEFQDIVEEHFQKIEEKLDPTYILNQFQNLNNEIHSISGKTVVFTKIFLYKLDKIVFKQDLMLKITQQINERTQNIEKKVEEFGKISDFFNQLSPLKEVKNRIEIKTLPEELQYQDFSQEFFLVDSSKKFYELIKDPKCFLEHPYKEWINKKKNLFFFGNEKDSHRKVNNLLELTTSHKIVLLHGVLNVGKSTFLLYFIDECLKNKNFDLIIFIHPLNPYEDFFGILEQIDKIIKEQYEIIDSNRILLVLDGLKREESEKNFVKKCLVLFKGVINCGFKLITTLETSQLGFLKKLQDYLNNHEIIEWKKLGDSNIKEELIKPNDDPKYIETIVKNYLNFNHYKKNIVNDNQFKECINFFKNNYKGIIGDIVFVLTDITNSNQVFSIETIKEYPRGMINLRWLVIKRDYYVENDETLPSILYLLSEHEDSLTEEFVFEFAKWSIDNSSCSDKNNILAKVKNFWKYYTIPIQRRSLKEERYLRKDWKIAIKEALTRDTKELSSAIQILKDIENKFYTNLIAFFSRISKKWENGELNQANYWYVVADIAKFCGLKKLGKDQKLKALQFATRFYIENAEAYNTTPPLNFLKTTLSTILQRLIKEGFIENYEFACDFLEKVYSLDFNDYWACWLIGKIYEENDKFNLALKWYIKSVNIQNTSKSYGILINIIEKFCKKHELPDKISLWYYELQEKLALKAIEVSFIDSRDWWALTRALENKGKIFLKVNKFHQAIQNFDNAIKSLRKSIEFDTILRLKKYTIFKQNKIAEILKYRANSNARLGNYEKALEDSKSRRKKLNELELQEIKEAQSDVDIYTKHFVKRKFFTLIIESILDITKSIIRGNPNKKISNMWIDIKNQLDYIDIKNIDDLKISAIYQSIYINNKNTKAINILNILTKSSFDYLRREKKYTSKYHKETADLKKGISEVFHTIFSAVINTMNLYLYPRETNKEELSKQWGLIKNVLINKYVPEFIPHIIPIRCFEFSIYFKESNIASLTNLGWEYFYNYDYVNALEIFKYGLKLEENLKKEDYKHNLQIGLAKTYEARGNFKLASEWFEKGITTCQKIYDENNPQYLYDSLIKTAENFNRLKFFVQKNEMIEFLNESLKYYKEALIIIQKNIPKGWFVDPHFPIQKMIQLLEMEKKWEEENILILKRNLEEVLEVSTYDLILEETENSDTLYSKGYFLTKMKHYGDAIKIYKNIPKKTPFVWINMGQNYGNLKKYNCALDCSNKALKMDPSNAFALHNKGYYLYKLGENIKAIDFFEESLKMNPKYPPSMYNKGQCLHKLGKYEEAVNLYSKALDLEPNNKYTLQHKGYSLILLRRYEEAVECNNKALDIDPKFYRAWNNNSQAFQGLGKYEQAFNCINKALEIALELGIDKSINEKDRNNFASILDNKGYILIKVRKPKIAMKALDEALKINRKYRSAWLNKFFASLYISYEENLKETHNQPIFTTPALIVKEAFSEINDKKKLKEKLNNAVLHWFKKVIFEYNTIDSKESLKILINNFENAFNNLGIQIPTLDNIKNICKKSKKYEENKKKVDKLFLEP